MVDDRTFYALLRTGRDGKPRYDDIFPSCGAVRMCMGDSEHIHKIKLRVVGDGETSSYWGWWATPLVSMLGNSTEREPGSFSMVYASRAQAEICFAYGYKVEEECGNGKLVNLVLEPIA